MSDMPMVGLQEAVARELIRDRTRGRPVVAQRHVRVALLLRRLAERLDPEPLPAPAPVPPRRGPVGSRPGGIRAVGAR